jgi:hypothetical protein
MNKKDVENRFCSKCRNNSILHIGDKVTFAGNKTQFSHSELRHLANLRGLLFTGKQKRVKIGILNPNGAKRIHYKSASHFAEFVMSPDEFKESLKKICRGKLPQERSKPPFKHLLSPGSRVYFLGSEKQLQTLSKFVEKSGARITNRRTKTMVAVVASKKSISTGQKDFFRFLGVPVYFFENLKLRD